MAKNPSFKAPFGEPIQIDSDGPISLDKLEECCRTRPRGFTMRIRTEQGNNERGGYLFHIKEVDEKFVILDYRKRIVWKFESTKDLLKFLNHAAGRRFDQDMLHVSEEINRTMGDLGARE